MSKCRRRISDVYRFNEEQSDAGYFVKHYYMRRWDYYLKDMLVDPIGLGAFKKSLELNELEVSAAEPVAAVLLEGSALKKDSILINREVKNNLLLSEYLLEENLKLVSNEQVLDLFKETGRIFGRMLNNDFIHTDTNPKNFLIQFDVNWQSGDSRQKVFLIDIDDIFDLSFFPVPEIVKISTVASFLARIKERLVKSSTELRSEIIESFLSEFLDIYYSKKDDEYIWLKVKSLIESKLKRRSQK